MSFSCSCSSVERRNTSAGVSCSSSAACWSFIWWEKSAKLNRFCEFVNTARLFSISYGFREQGFENVTKEHYRHERICVTCSLLSLSLFRMSSIRSRAFSRSCRSFCQYFSSSLTACNFASGSLWEVMKKICKYYAYTGNLKTFNTQHVIILSFFCSDFGRKSAEFKHG